MNANERRQAMPVVDKSATHASKDGARRIRLLIADDHPVVRRGLIAMANDEPDMQVVTEAKNGGDVIDLFRLCQPDVTRFGLS